MDRDYDKLKLPKNEQDRIKIDSEVAEFLARGGSIKTYDHTANHGYNQPVKRERKAQVEYMRRRNKITPCG